MSYRKPLSQHSRTPLQRRARYLLSRLFGTRLQKSQRVYVVEAAGHRFKRCILRDSHLAARIEQNLERFGDSPRIPALVARYENEVWLEFIEGRPLDRADAELVNQIAGLYAEIHSRGPRTVATADSGFVRQLQRDLGFLRQVAVLGERACSELAAAAELLAPEAVWVGFDYTDPVLKNFVRAADDGRICAVDVESLLDGQLLGTGAAKALLRWMEPHRAVFLDTLEELGAPDFRSYLPFVELAFLASYTKLMFLEKKWRNVDPSRFERFRKP